jgi:hypothetical protein
MNRTEEYKILMAETNEVPAALEFTVSRAGARWKQRRRGKRLISLPLGSVCAVFAAFVLLVNVSMPFARACGRLPVLRELATAVAFSPSLSAAVEHEFVQPLALAQTENEITMRVEYVIVDQKQLNIFYSLESDRYSNLDANPEIRAAGETPLEGFSVFSDTARKTARCARSPSISSTRPCRTA